MAKKKKVATSIEEVGVVELVKVRPEVNVTLQRAPKNTSQKLPTQIYPDGSTDNHYHILIS